MTQPIGAPTLMVMAGGTGGHVFPGLAVAQALQAKGWRVVWLGNANSMEGQLVPKYGIPLESIDFGGVRGKGLMNKVQLPVRLVKACLQSLRVLRKVKPDVLLGMGGYITFPAGLMAAVTGRPVVLHEQNSIAGLANKALAKVARKVLCAFPNAIAGAQWVGNPLRKAVSDLALQASPLQRYAQRTGPLQVLVVGGSLGAAALNEMVPQALALIPVEQRPQVTHQAGMKQFDALQAHYAKAGVQGNLVPFIDEMAQAYANADVVICRAGAMTVAELAAIGVASILVPFPYAVDDHQTTNARFLSDAGAAQLLPQTQLQAASLAQTLQNTSRTQWGEMANKAFALGKIDATEQVAQVCERIAQVRSATS